MFGFFNYVITIVKSCYLVIESAFGVHPLCRGAIDTDNGCVLLILNLTSDFRKKILSGK